VDSHGEAVGEVTILRVVEREAERPVVLGTALDDLLLHIDGLNHGAGAVEHTKAMVVAQGR